MSTAPQVPVSQPAVVVSGTMQRTRSALVASLPEGWLYKEQMTLLEPAGRTNVIFSSEPLAPSMDTEAYATAQGDLLEREFPEYQQLAFEPMSMLGGRMGFLRRFEWKPPDQERVTQLQIYYADGGRGYTATATALTAEFPTYELVLASILEQLDATKGQ